MTSDVDFEKLDTELKQIEKKMEHAIIEAQYLYSQLTSVAGDTSKMQYAVETLELFINKQREILQYMKQLAKINEMVQNA